METLTSSAAVPIHHRTSNYDEMSMHQSLLFADSLKVFPSSHGTYILCYHLILVLFDMLSVLFVLPQILVPYP